MLRKVESSVVIQDCGLCKHGIYRWEEEKIDYPWGGYDLMYIELVDCPLINRKDVIPCSYEPICKNYNVG